MGRYLRNGSRKKGMLIGINVKVLMKWFQDKGVLIGKKWKYLRNCSGEGDIWEKMEINGGVGKV